MYAVDGSYRADLVTLHVAISTYNRLPMLRLLLEDIARERPSLDVVVRVYDDHTSEPERGELGRIVDDWTHAGLVQEWHRFDEHGGKPKYWRSVRLALSHARDAMQEGDVLVHLQDDNRLAEGGLAQALRWWEAIRAVDDRARALNLWLDVQRFSATCWTGVLREPVQTGEGLAWRTQWTEPTFIASGDLFTALGDLMPPVPQSRWAYDRTLSSGVGRHLSLELHHAGYTIYQVPRSLVYHGDHASLLNPVARRREPLTSEWWPDKDQSNEEDE